jgi:UDP-MurNAc hydroxylase
MQFTILSHAGLLVEHQGVRVVCDPWLIGSCYWRSWWNFPEPDPKLIDNLNPHFIYLTHLHWDHFHGPSLKKLFDPKTVILVPKVTTRRMLEDLNWLGFHNIVEIPHGGSHRLGDDFVLHSYQFGLTVDSAAVLSGGGVTLFNCNDCKFFGLPLAQVLGRHPRIDFIFRSHSSASPVPLCIENHEQFIPANDDSYDSADQFARCALFSGARYAIPFASNHCFLHAETRRFNATATTPDLAKKRYAQIARDAGAKTECVVMPPGSRWSDAGGFDIVPFDFANRQSYVDLLLQQNAAKLAAQETLESQSVADFEAFRDYFAGMIAAVPRLMRRRMTPLIFKVRDHAGSHHWSVDCRHAEIKVVDSVPSGSVVFEVQAAVLNDCARQRMFSVWTASKRLKIHLPSGESLREANLWFTLLDLYEVDLLPLRKNFSFRAIGVRLRRWREPVEVANILVRRLLLGQRFSVSRIYPLVKVSPH